MEEGSGMPIPKFKTLNTRKLLLLGSSFSGLLHIINEANAEDDIHIEMCKLDFWVNG
jgi:hypothetical protein